MKIAIVHEWLANMGGSEKVVLAFKELFPEAPIYTTVYNPAKVPAFQGMDIRTSFIQRLPFGKTKYQSYLPLMPTAVEQFDLSGYDVVLSSSHAVAKGVLTGAKTLHITYNHTPMRYGWDFYHEYLGETKGLKRCLIPWLMNYLRMWDRLSADRVDYFIANSHYVARRIKKHYHREATVIHPMVDAQFYTPGTEAGDFYFVVSRLVGYKRVDIAVEACNRLGANLVVIGDGPERKRLEEMAGPTVKILGRRSDEEIRDHYRRCRAFLFPGEEDFGITPLEAQACGRPVIAYGVGGALETVVQGKTGLFFSEQTPEGLIEAIRKFETMSIDQDVIRAHAEAFDTAYFKARIKAFVEEKYQQFQLEMKIGINQGFRRGWLQ